MTRSQKRLRKQPGRSRNQGALLRSATALSAAIVLAVAARPAHTVQAQAPARGTIKGHVRVMGPPPGNPVIRMGMDPMCARTNAGKRIVQEIVVATADGSLANVFAHLQGTFPQTPVPTAAVTLDQRGCIYTPRMTGARVGQTLQVHNSDDFLHNVHSLSNKGNDFNISEPKAGMVQQFKMKAEEVMLHVKCDVHSWMTAWIGIVPNPYFAVSGTDGTFTIANVPAGAHPVQIWHERFGVLTQNVQVKAGQTTTVEFMYTGKEKAPTAGIQEITLPATARAAVLLPPTPAE